MWKNIRKFYFYKEKNITKSQFHYFKKKLNINKETLTFPVYLNLCKNSLKSNQTSAYKEDFKRSSVNTLY